MVHKSVYPFHIVNNHQQWVQFGPMVMYRGLRASRETRCKGVPGAGGRFYLGQDSEVPVPKLYCPVGIKGADVGLFTDVHALVSREC